jgi:hypothetical protein
VEERAAEELLASTMWGELERRMKTGIVMLCEAGCCWLVNDGIRLMPIDVEGWMIIDTAFRIRTKDNLAIVKPMYRF